MTLLSLRCRKKRATAGAAVKSCSRSKRKTTFGHRKSGKHERIRNTLEGDGLPQPFTRLRNDKGRVGTDYHSRLRGFAMTRGVETDYHTPYGGLACRLGRCFCFAEVSAGHPHRNDNSFQTPLNRRKTAVILFLIVKKGYKLRKCLTMAGVF